MTMGQGMHMLSNQRLIYKRKYIVIFIKAAVWIETKKVIKMMA